MPRRTSHEPPAAPSGLRAAFICRKPGPSLRKGARGGHPAARESGLRPAEGDPGLSLRSVRRRAFREYRAAGGGCRPAQRPDAALPRLERQTTPAASRPREAATLRRTSAHRLSARTVPRRRIDRLRNRTVSHPAAASAPSVHRPAGLFLRKSVVLHPATAD